VVASESSGFPYELGQMKCINSDSKDIRSDLKQLKQSGPRSVLCHVFVISSSEL